MRTTRAPPIDPLSFPPLKSTGFPAQCCPDRLTTSMQSTVQLRPASCHPSAAWTQPYGRADMEARKPLLPRECPVPSCRGPEGGAFKVGLAHQHGILIANYRSNVCVLSN